MALLRASDDEKRSDNFWPSDWSKLFWEEKERRQGEEEIEESRKEGRWTKRGQRKGRI